MTDQTTLSLRLRRLAQMLGIAQAIILFVTVVLIVAGRSAVYSGWGFRGFPSVFSFMFSVAGLVILQYHPKHAVGWTFMILGLLTSIQALLFEYGTYALVLYPGSLPGGVFVAWVLNWYWMILFIPMSAILILFPDGNLPSPRWQPFFILVLCVTILAIGLASVTPGPLDSSFEFLDNPYAITQLGGAIVKAEYINLILIIVLLPLFGLALAGLITKMRRSQGREREQFKWFVFAGAFLIITFPTAALPSRELQLFFIAAMFFLPVAMGIAIVRHRLYDIDLIIRRTLVYSIMTALLALIYLGGIVLFQNLFVTFTGQTQSQLVTVISTLSIAALFFPVRNRVQNFIDQRFYRRKYDIAKTLAAFANTARDEVELEKLTAQLLEVVGETMQPQRAGLWLKDFSNDPQRNKQA
jgi:hypothetical protein